MKISPPVQPFPGRTQHESYLGLSKLYRRTSKQQEAKGYLATATAMYREMDMTYWLEQAVETGGVA